MVLKSNKVRASSALFLLRQEGTAPEMLFLFMAPSLRYIFFKLLGYSSCAWYMYLGGYNLGVCLMLLYNDHPSISFSSFSP